MKKQAYWLLLLPLLANAASVQELVPIRDAAVALIEQQLPVDANERRSVEAGALDARLRLDLCGAPLQAKLAPGSGLTANTTVAISCTQPKPWTVYVPVRINRYSSVVTSRQSLMRGTRLSSGDVQVSEANIQMARGQGYQAITDVTGAKLKRALGPSQIITSNDICLVCRGEPVMIVARSANLEVKIPGLAIGDGTMGDTISVRNRDSKRLVDGQVISAGVVEIRL